MATYGLIGRTLVHSVSPEIHALLGLQGYEKIELSEEELGAFLEKKTYAGCNVTIPYKEAVLPFLAGVSDEAKQVGAVNTLVLTEKGYVGYNTDAGGMAYALKKAGIAVSGKHVLILGTGGTSKTAEFVAKTLGAASVQKVGRTSPINYDNVYERGETQVILNTTPVGMFPAVDARPLDPSRFLRLTGVFDCIYNPTPTKLVAESRKLGIPAENGLTMLVEQARLAEELFLNKPIPSSLTDEVVKKIKIRL